MGDITSPWRRPIAYGKKSEIEEHSLTYDSTC